MIFNSQINFFKKFLCVKKFGPRSGLLSNVEPDLGPNCLQRLSADNTRKQRSKVFCLFDLIL